MFLVIIKNTGGRPCAWGLSPDPSKARGAAETQWHEYVIGEAGFAGLRGETVLHEVLDAPVTTEPAPEPKPHRHTVAKLLEAFVGAYAGGEPYIEVTLECACGEQIQVNVEKDYLLALSQWGE